MDGKMKLTLFIPVLNEAACMREIMPRVPRELFEQILVVDGGSTDGSAELARSMGFDVLVQGRPGLRNAYIEGWPLIRGDFVLTFSPDGNCRPQDMPGIVAKLREGFDMVIGSRYLGPARSEDDDWVTGFGNWMFTSLMNVLHGGRYTDVMNIYRAYRTSLFYELDLHREESYFPDRYLMTVVGVEPLLSLRAARTGLKVAEVPAAEPKRIFGERKLQIVRWGSVHLVQVFRELYCWKGVSRR
jgi:glycosyltransferase involved in cell wall biosynthesis